MMYAWASPAYILDEMSLEQLMMYYEKGCRVMELQANIFWSVLGESSTPNLNNTQVDTKSSTAPDIAKFREIYGDKIRRG